MLSRIYFEDIFVNTFSCCSSPSQVWPSRFPRAQSPSCLVSSPSLASTLLPSAGGAPRVDHHLFYPWVLHGNPLQCSCLGNSMERSLAGYSARGCNEVDMTKQLNNTSPLLLFSLSFPFPAQSLQAVGS